MRPRTELEAFDEIIKCCNEYHHWFTDDNIETIEGYPIEKIRKALAALEIIKNKGVDVDMVRYHKNLDNYNFALRGRYPHLTQEEFDLLKEVLQ